MLVGLYSPLPIGLCPKWRRLASKNAQLDNGAGGARSRPARFFHFASPSLRGGSALFAGLPGGEGELRAVAGADDELGRGAELAGEEGLGEGRLEVVLDGAAEGARAEGLVEALVEQEVPGRFVEFDGDALGRREPVRDALELDVEDLRDVGALELAEDDDVVEAVEELGLEDLAGLGHELALEALEVLLLGVGREAEAAAALAGAIVEAIKRAVPVPVTVKFRKGWDSDTCVSFAKVLEEHGADLLTLHPRTRIQQYEGTADRSAIAAVKAAVSVPVIGNGDITSGESALSMLSETGCDGLMVGRGALGHPWIFREIKAALKGEPYTAPSIPERLEIALRHAECIEAQKGAHGLIELRKHLPRYLAGMRNAAALRLRLNEANSIAEIRQLLLDSTKNVTI